jgi:Rrf2 family transcriptional regulator, cysteine metabolism repressor
MVSQKCQYAVRAVFELAKRHGQGPVKISDIAAAQAIPMRFLEIIMNQLRRAGFVESRRGPEGGYLLSSEPVEMKIGSIIRFIEGPQVPVSCMTDENRRKCSLKSRCVFLGMWSRAAKALSEVYDQTSFQDLVEDEKRIQRESSSTYSI